MRSRYFYRLLSVLLLAGYAWVGIHWFMDYRSAHGNGEVTICLMKNLTDTPCPSCGSTRSLLTLFEGKWIEAIFINPLGILMGVFMLILPVWVIRDYLQSKESLFNTYQRAEQVLKRKGVLLVFATLILANWIWNISKGL
ncbi:MAG: DUF2752 domain-containing protein [Saprospirales bacterium]|nr:MAG: DUF2752 domain-containing protein [Saprospirales bacterium]